ncbi:MAG TPA: NAD(P)H-hydrate dehydratase [Terriglobia bacterium]|nr:NAD(P)H-hydrate dehydratase [Terriglobia bacterium]
MKILTASQMQRIDKLTTERYGIPSATLMENAGAGVVELLFGRFAPLDRHQITIFCGRGNNGGDGLVVARLLRDKGLSPRVLLFAKPDVLKGDAALNYQRLAACAKPEEVPDSAAWRQVKPSLAGTSLIIDALLGTGLSKPLEGFLLEVVRDLNNGFPGARRIAVDLPSGLSSDTGELVGECLRADASVTFTAPKYAHVFPPACEMVGKWKVHEIGTPREALENDPELFLRLITREDLLWLTQPRKIDSHKGTYGHVLILAGSVGKTGAAAMAAKAALRSGAGLVTIATAKSALPVIATLGMEFMTEALPETSDGTISFRALEEGKLDQLLEGKSVLAIGPGMGRVDETSELVRQAANRYDLPMVLDADALNAFAGRMNEMKAQGRVRVLTPHPGEMARLAGLKTADVQKRRIEVAREFAMRCQTHLVLKGTRTLVASPEGEVAVNPTGNPGMATGGTGDCLTGMIAGLLAQHLDRTVADVVSAAVYLHGLAGDFAARKMGEASMIAGDLLEAIPKAFRALPMRGGCQHHST